MKQCAHLAVDLKSVAEASADITSNMSNNSLRLPYCTLNRLDSACQHTYTLDAIKSTAFNTLQNEKKKINGCVHTYLLTT